MKMQDILKMTGASTRVMCTDKLTDYACGIKRGRCHDGKLNLNFKTTGGRKYQYSLTGEQSQ